MQVETTGFLALTAIESEDDEEVNAVEAVLEIVEITVDSGAAKSIWPSRMKGVERTMSTRTLQLAAANGSPIRVEGDARLEVVRNGKKCSTRFLDADVKIPLASVRACPWQKPITTNIRRIVSPTLCDLLWTIPTKTNLLE